MPTPSSNPPPEPPGAGTQAFPTCPEDATPTTTTPTNATAATTATTSAEAALAQPQPEGNQGDNSSNPNGDGDNSNNDNNNNNSSVAQSASSPAETTDSFRSATASPTPQEPATGPTTAATSPTADEPDPESESTPKPDVAAPAQPQPLQPPQPQLGAPARQSAMRPTPNGWVCDDDNGDDDNNNDDAWWASDVDRGVPWRTPAPAPSLLRAGSRYHGTQQSAQQRYDVHVEIQHVNLSDSFLCGYLKIQGLTEDHPTLTTYFEGEIIGTKHTFITNDWGADDTTDINHWSKFNAFRWIERKMRKNGDGGSGITATADALSRVVVHDISQQENIFMRWKEKFLVPDHRVRTIIGASFEGFYYICFNQVRGEISGIYFHRKSERFQQLQLKHVPDRGCFGAMEFR